MVGFVKCFVNDARRKAKDIYKLTITLDSLIELLEAECISRLIKLNIDLQSFYKKKKKNNNNSTLYTTLSVHNQIMIYIHMLECGIHILKRK